jgi:hypothetical protein
LDCAGFTALLGAQAVIILGMINLDLVVMAVVMTVATVFSYVVARPVAGKFPNSFIVS